MSVLSEGAIKRFIRDGYVIAQGDEASVRGSSYSCHAARILPGGPGEPDKQPGIVDWTGPAGPPVYRVQPRQLVWVRIREVVRLPSDVCAFWWQTNTLSRKGLMLVNMSMVDAGYEGPLACLFVNFGRQPVDIDPGMTVARLVFHRLDGQSTPYGAGAAMDAYDRELREVAMSGSSSFLSFQEFSGALQEEKAKVISDIRQSADAYGVDLKTQLAGKADDLFKERIDNLPKFLLRSYAYAFAGFVLLTLALTVAPWVKDRLSLDVKDQIKTAVEAELGRRLEPVSLVGAGGTATIEQRLQGLEAEIRALQQQQRQSAAPPGK